MALADHLAVSYSNASHAKANTTVYHVRLQVNLISLLIFASDYSRIHHGISF